MKMKKQKSTTQNGKASQGSGECRGGETDRLANTAAINTLLLLSSLSRAA